MSIDAAFQEFHSLNPHVYERLEAIALELYSLGRTHISLRDLWGFLRIQQLRTVGSDPFKFNNNFTSRYARLLLEKHPELSGAIETRDMPSASVPVEVPQSGLHDFMAWLQGAA